jgi:hypothetical protein
MDSSAFSKNRGTPCRGREGSLLPFYLIMQTAETDSGNFKTRLKIDWTFRDSGKRERKETVGFRAAQNPSGAIRIFAKIKALLMGS